MEQPENPSEPSEPSTGQEPRPAATGSNEVDAENTATEKTTASNGEPITLEDHDNMASTPRTARTSISEAVVSPRLAHTFPATEPETTESLFAAPKSEMPATSPPSYRKNESDSKNQLLTKYINLACILFLIDLATVVAFVPSCFVGLITILGSMHAKTPPFTTPLGILFGIGLVLIPLSCYLIVGVRMLRFYYFLRYSKIEGWAYSLITLVLHLLIAGFPLTFPVTLFTSFLLTPIIVLYLIPKPKSEKSDQ